MSRWAVVLAGGTGSRFWPLSTPERPKQLIALLDSRPMLEATIQRLEPLIPVERILVLTNAGLVDAVAGLIPSLPAENIIAEPRPAGTAAALAWAAAEIRRRDGADSVMICVHADWAIGDEVAFRSALEAAAGAAEESNSLVTVGIVPSRPDPGFGYIQPGEQVEGQPGARRVARFVEKPDRAAAESMCADGYLWNSGIFVWRAGDFLAEINAHTPEVAPALVASNGDINAFFATTRSVSVDVGVMERSHRVLVMAGDFGWDDVGTWAALRRVLPRDEAGNATVGTSHAVQACNNVVHSDSSTVVLYGVSDLVVVVRDGLTLVTTVALADDLKKLVEALPPEVRDQ